MATVEVKCPYCGETNVNKYGKSQTGAQRYRCFNKDCAQKTFILDFKNNGCRPGIEEKIIDMAANASGIRDTARVLKVSKQKVSDTLKKQRHP